jgi:membrane-associated phospholipid phosphatase
MPELSQRNKAEQNRSDWIAVTGSQIWFKIFGVSAFISLFFVFYIYLLKNPAYPVVLMPVLALDDYVSFQPFAFPIYASLWVYVSFPVMLMATRGEIVRYGGWIGSLCAVSLGIFYFYPNAIPPVDIDWSLYPAIEFLKNIDASGNACPSLHVGTAVFTAIWLQHQLKLMRFGRLIISLNILWCVAIAYSTLATKQHVTVDVIAGACMGALVAWMSLRQVKAE